MKITANQLTTIRILLIPVPVALILMGDNDIKIVAWILYFLVGITDFFDGMLARKYGATKLGSLLDPIADKIYIALLFIPLGVLGWWPHWMVVAILIRDPIVTSLRSITQVKGVTMKTASLAQYKTAIQMIAGGYVIFVYVFPDRTESIIGMSIVIGLCLLWFLVYFYFRRRFHPRLLTLVGMVSMALVIRYFFSKEHTAFIYGITVLAMTWVSAANYLFLFGKKFSSGPGRISVQWWFLYFIESFAFPLMVLIMQFRKEIPVWIPMSVLCLEFAVGALDNLVTTEKIFRNSAGTGCKLFFQLLISCIILVKIYFPGTVPSSLDHELWVDAYMLVGITLLSFVFFFAQHGIKIITEKPS